MRDRAESVLRHLVLRAERQGGCLTAAQIREAGLTEGEIRTFVRRGRLQRRRLGAYVPVGVAPVPVGSLAGDAVLDLSAALLRHPDAVASHETGARVWCLPLIGRGVSAPETVTRPGTRPRTPTSAAHGRVLTSTLYPGHVVRREPWLPVTTPARTVADLARTRGIEDGLVAADAAAYAGLLDRETLGAVLDDCRDFPAIGRAVQVLECLDPLAESPLESLSRWRLRGYGVDLASQMVITDPHGESVGRVDFLLDGVVVGEADGRGKYADAADLWAEKRREDRLRELGFGFVRWGWDDMWLRPHEVAERLRSARARAPRIASGVRVTREHPPRRVG